ncbi:MAG: hypothetical protein WCP86_02775 [bacterium]
MGKLDIQLCSETGICSIIKADGSKVDLMPDEVSSLKKALGVPAAARSVIADVDVNFAKSLNAEELKQLATELKQSQPSKSGKTGSGGKCKCCS